MDGLGFAMNVSYNQRYETDQYYHFSLKFHFCSCQCIFWLHQVMFYVAQITKVTNFAK